MAGISIPGVSDKYKTNDLVEGLMKVERTPLTREQNTLEGYKTQQDAWRSVNQRMSSLRESVKTLYSFDNPFNNKLASSSNENAIYAEAGREAAYESFKVDVVTPATADRLLSKEIQKDSSVPEGTYTYKTGDKTVTMKWKGGKTEDFISALNKRGQGTIKASLIGVNKGNKALLIESLKTGLDNRLIFEDDALKFALDTEMIRKVQKKTESFGTKSGELSSLTNIPESEQPALPLLSDDGVKLTEKGINVPSRGGIEIKIPDSIKSNINTRIEFTVKATETEDITGAINERLKGPSIPDALSVEFGGIEVHNEKAETGITPLAPLDKRNTTHVLYAVMEDGSEKEIELSADSFSEEEQTVHIDIKDFNNIKAIAIKNFNTGTEIAVSEINAFDIKASTGYEGVNPVSEAGDAVIKYEGITITRPENTIDDVVPHVTLHLQDKTEVPATISIKPDTESAKDALINFVGKYNQTIAEMNILSQNKPELISELDYLSPDEKEDYTKKLGLFFNDHSISSAKSNLQQIVSAKYSANEYNDITLLSQIGISTNATNYSGYNPGKMRGYLEIDEKKLDENLKNNLDQIKVLFGYDSDGDLIIDSGIGYLMDKQLTAYVRSGGILAGKTSTLDRQIKASEAKITKLESQLDQKEAELRSKFGVMESTLNNLEGQSNSINNFTNQQNRNR